MYFNNKKPEVPAPIVPPPTESMRTIVNESLQSFQICLLSPKGNTMVTLGPRKAMTVKQSELSKMVYNLAQRKIVKII